MYSNSALLAASWLGKPPLAASLQPLAAPTVSCNVKVIPIFRTSRKPATSKQSQIFYCCPRQTCLHRPLYCNQQSPKFVKHENSTAKQFLCCQSRQTCALVHLDAPVSKSIYGGICYSICISALWRKQGIREIKVCKKCPKVSPYCNAIFDPILFKPLLDGAK